MVKFEHIFFSGKPPVVNCAAVVSIVDSQPSDYSVAVGSSMGGATVLEAAKRGVVRSPVVLLAPALKKVITLKSSEQRRNDIMEAWYAEFNSQVSEAVKKRSVIVHGVLDDVVPIEDSREFSARTGIRLVEVPGEVD